MKLLLASGNRHKRHELAALLSNLDIEILTPDHFPELPSVEEDGESFEANALKKARSAYMATSLSVLADDSGLEVDALGGKPGIFSARYSGQHGNDVANYKKVLDELVGIPRSKRTARFHCVLALVEANDAVGPMEHVFHGTCEGVIETSARGTHGFGYDPIFFIEETQKTMAELIDEEKNRISHRARALEKLYQFLSTREPHP